MVQWCSPQSSGLNFYVNVWFAVHFRRLSFETKKLQDRAARSSCVALVFPGWENYISFFLFYCSHAFTAYLPLWVCWGWFASSICAFIAYSHFTLQIIIACSKGGTSIEDLAEKYPDMIIKVYFPIRHRYMSAFPSASFVLFLWDFFFHIGTNWCLPRNHWWRCCQGGRWFSLKGSR